MAGDFNCVTSQLDVQTQQANPAQNSRLIGGDSLQAVQAEQGLMDVWRLHNPQAMEYPLDNSVTGLYCGTAAN